MSGVRKSRFKPSRISWPRLSWPITAVTVISAIVETVAMRMPAMIAGSASGTSTRTNCRAAGVAHALRGVAHVFRHARRDR